MKKKSDKKLSLAVTILSCWFILLCSVHLIQQRPLWNDEIAVYESVEHFTPKEMFGQPLRAVQVFPRAYLFLIQQFSKVFDFNLWSLRLPSFVCMIAAFLLWLKIAKKGIKDRWQYLAFVGSWIASGLLLYYSAELKQYSMDVLAAAAFIYFIYHQTELQQRNDKRYIWMLALLPAFGLFSYPAFMLMMIPFYNLIRSSITCKICRKYLCVYALSMLTVMGLSYYFDMRLRPVSVVTQGFGDYFISFESFGEFFRSLGEGINNLFSRWFLERPKYFKSITRIFTGFALIYMFYGYFRNWKKEEVYIRTLETAAFILFLEMFLIGCLQKYPFTVPRTSLFYAPVVLYMTAKGIGLAGKVHPYFYRLILGLYYVFLGFLIIMQSMLAFNGMLGFYPALW